MTAAYNDTDVRALTAVTCASWHGLGAPARPCFACRTDAARLLDAVAPGIVARALREAPRRSTAWDNAIAVKLGVGLVLATVVAPAIAAVVDVATRHWPTGGAR